jgi:uncharacterized membrane protein
LEILTTICIGLMIGVELAVAVFINPIVVRLPGAARAKMTRLSAKRLGTVMPFWYVAGLLLLAGEIVVRRHSSGAHLVWAAGSIWAIVIFLTILFLVPINNRIASMDSSAFTEQLQREHTRWDLLHRWRVIALIVSLSLFLIGIRT